MCSAPPGLKGGRLSVAEGLCLPGPVLGPDEHRLTSCSSSAYPCETGRPASVTGALARSLLAQGDDEPAWEPRSSCLLRDFHAVLRDPRDHQRLRCCREQGLWFA